MHELKIALNYVENLEFVRNFGVHQYDVRMSSEQSKWHRYHKTGDYRIDRITYGQCAIAHNPYRFFFKTRYIISVKSTGISSEN